MGHHKKKNIYIYTLYILRRKDTSGEKAVASPRTTIPDQYQKLMSLAGSNRPFNFTTGDSIAAGTLPQNGYIPIQAYIILSAL